MITALKKNGNNDMDDFAQKLRQIRHEKDLSLEDCSKDLKIPVQMLAMIELGEIIPTAKQAEAIMEYILKQI
jgi:transcriptional regulator with XRE-family HTH domain